MAASSSTVGSTIRPQSAKTSAPRVTWCGSQSIIRKKLETVLTPGAAPMICSAARTVSAVVATAPPTVPSASPARTIIAANIIGSVIARAAAAASTPLCRRKPS